MLIFFQSKATILSSRGNQLFSSFFIVISVFCSLMIECFGILNDIIVLALFFPSGQWSSTMKFSAVMAIFNLIVRYNVKSNNQSRQSLAVKFHSPICQSYFHRAMDAQCKVHACSCLKSAWILFMEF